MTHDDIVNLPSPRLPDPKQAALVEQFPELATIQTDAPASDEAIVAAVEGVMSLPGSPTEELEIPEGLLTITRDEVIEGFIKRTGSDIVAYVRNRTRMYWEREILLLRQQIKANDANLTEARNIARAEAFGIARALVLDRLDSLAALIAPTRAGERDVQRLLEDVKTGLTITFDHHIETATKGKS